MTCMVRPHSLSRPGRLQSIVRDGRCAHVSCEQSSWLPSACPAIEEVGTPKTFGAGDTIFWEDDHASSYFIIESGVGRGCRILPDGRRQICRFVFPGDLIAHSDTGRYPYTVEAITPITAMVVPRVQFQHILERMDCIRKLLMDSMLAELRESQDQVLVLGRMTAVERVSHFFYTLATRTQTDPSQPLIIPMNRTDIADYLGLTLETVSRVIGRLKREGKIRLISANRIAIHSPSLLSCEEKNEAA